MPFSRRSCILGRGPRRLMEPMKPMEPMEPMKGPGRWWPEGLGQPTTSGGQDDLKYAYFADRRRLAVSRGSEVTLYDTGDQEIRGVSQQQGGKQGDVVFSSKDGEVPLGDLKVIDSPQ